MNNKMSLRLTNFYKNIIINISTKISPMLNNGVILTIFFIYKYILPT